MNLQYFKCSILICLLLGLGACQSSPEKNTDEDSPLTMDTVIDKTMMTMETADSNYSTRNYKAALAGYEAVVKGDPVNVKAHYRIGNIMFRAQRWADARRSYEKVIELKPSHAKAHYNLAMTYLTLAERHLKFYAANVDRTEDISAVSDLIDALENISNPNTRRSRPKEPTPVDRLEQRSSGGSSNLENLLDQLSH